MKTAMVPVVLAALLAAGGAAAQTLYKSTMPDGKVVYGEKPAPGAAKVDTITPPPAKTGVSGLTPEERARAANNQQQQRTQAAAAGSPGGVDEARKALAAAEAARDAGKEPLPNERSGIAGGGSRLNEAYFARQKTLEDAVTAARKRLTDAGGK